MNLWALPDIARVSPLASATKSPSCQSDLYGLQRGGLGPRVVLTMVHWSLVLRVVNGLQNTCYGVIFSVLFVTLRARVWCVGVC